MVYHMQDTRFSMDDPLEGGAQRMSPVEQSHDPILTTTKLARIQLKDQAAELLREYIIGGKIEPGSKLVEREVAAMLGISRAPARDALMQLEQEGLLVSRPDARYVINLSEGDIRNIYQVRLTLETLAAEQAALHTSEKNYLALNEMILRMAAAIQSGDMSAYTRSDLGVHQLIWQQSENPYLVQALNTMVGPIFMFVNRHTELLNFPETLDLHSQLIEAIHMGDQAAARKAAVKHQKFALQSTLKIFHDLHPARLG
jgi:DNA-binding GntR family transcriptional regulator